MVECTGNWAIDAVGVCGTCIDLHVFQTQLVTSFIAGRPHVDTASIAYKLHNIV